MDPIEKDISVTFNTDKVRSGKRKGKTESQMNKDTQILICCKKCQTSEVNFILSYVLLYQDFIKPSQIFQIFNIYLI